MEHLRQVPRSWGHNMAERLGCEFYETSASEGWSKAIKSPALSPETPAAPTTIHAHPKLRHVNSTELAHGENKVKNTQKISVEPPKGFTHFRRKSAPIGNTLLSIKNNFSAIHQNGKVIKSKENSAEIGYGSDSGRNDNNNNSIRVRRCPPLVAVSINPNPEILEPKFDDSVGIRGKRSGSIGRNFMKKLSPRLSRKTNNSGGLTRHGESVARGLASVGNAFTFGTLAKATSKSASQIPQNRHFESSAGDSSGDSPENKTKRRVFLEIPSSSGTDHCGSSSSDEDLEHIILSMPGIENQDPHTTIKTRNVQIPSVKISHECEHIENSINYKHQEKPLIVINRTQYLSERELIVEQMAFSEPFRFICRDIKISRRSRDRSKSPSQFLKIKNGIRRIKTFASEQHNNYHSIKPIHNNNNFQAGIVRP